LFLQTFYFKNKKKKKKILDISTLLYNYCINMLTN